MNAMKNKTITIYSDPGHAWAKVSKADKAFQAIRDKVSNFSYETTTHVFLEEDCDLKLYIDKLIEMGYTKENLKYRFFVAKERSSRIRSYPRFQA